MKYSVNFDIELKKNPYPGTYIALEGIDGSGKTTQVEKLAEHYRSQGKEVVITHEPRRDGVMGQLVTEVLLGKVKLPKVAIQYLFAAQRATFLEELIIPALKEGKIVISDRCLWSAIPYGLLDKQESKKEENVDQLLVAYSVLSMYHEFIVPDKTFLLDVSVSAAEGRIEEQGKELSIYEKRGKLLKIEKEYNFLLEKFPDALIRISAEKDVADVTAEILTELKKLSK